MVLDRIAAREEDDDLFLEVLAEEGEEKEEATIAIANDVALLKAGDSRGFFVGVDVDVQRTGSKGDAGEIVDLGRLRRREEHRLSVVCAYASNSDKSPDASDANAPCGSFAIILRISSSKPTSSMRSASSMTSVRKLLKTKPGVFCVESGQLSRHEKEKANAPASGRAAVLASR